MRIFLLSLGMAAAVCGWSAPASAATEPVAQVYEAGRCMVSRDRDAAVALIRSLPLDADQVDLSTVHGRAAECARGVPGGSTAMMVRGAIAQALFFRDFHRFHAPPQIRTRLVNLNLPVESSPSGTPLIELYRWADCVVRNDPPMTERLMRSAVGSTEESAAFTGLQTYMSACTPAGSRLLMRPWEARSVLVQSAYHSMYRYHSGALGEAPYPRHFRRE